MERREFNLRGFLLRDLYRVTDTEEVAIEWCQNQDLLWQYPQCWQCGQLMKYEKQKQRFRCQLGTCPNRPSQYLREGTFFFGSRLSISQGVQFIYFWCLNRFHQSDFMEQLGIQSEHTVVKWKDFCREICAKYFFKNPVRIGGPGKTVEIDESLLVRRKYNVGRVVKEQWVFGGIEVGSSKCFLVKVDKRDAATLYPLIKEYILPGTTIVSDKWAAYNAIDRDSIPRPYLHLSVN